MLVSRAKPATPLPRLSMSDVKASYSVQISGLWSPRHTFCDAEGQKLGVLSVSRNRYGMIISGEYRPEKGEVLYMRRDPGLLRAQFSLWTDGGEWLGSSLRWNVFRRQVDISTGSKNFRVVPTTGLGGGWRLVAPRTGASAQIRSGLFGRRHQVSLFRKIDFELVVFAHFLGSLTHWESLLPTALDHVKQAQGEAVVANKA